MTKRLDCPVDDCSASIEAESEAEVMAQAEQHAGSEHPELDLDDDTVAMIRSNIRET